MANTNGKSSDSGAQTENISDQLPYTSTTWVQKPGKFTLLKAISQSALVACK